MKSLAKSEEFFPSSNKGASSLPLVHIHPYLSPSLTYYGIFFLSPVASPNNWSDLPPSPSSWLTTELER